MDFLKPKSNPLNEMGHQLEDSERGAQAGDTGPKACDHAHARYTDVGLRALASAVAAESVYLGPKANIAQHANTMIYNNHITGFGLGSISTPKLPASDGSTHHQSQSVWTFSNDTSVTQSLSSLQHSLSSRSPNQIGSLTNMGQVIGMISFV